MDSSKLVNFQVLTDSGEDASKLVNFQVLTNTGEDASKLVNFQVLTASGVDSSKQVHFAVLRNAGENVTKLVDFAVLVQSGLTLSKDVSYAILNRTGPDLSKDVSYAVLNQAGQDLSKDVSYAVLSGSGIESASKLISYVVLTPIGESTSKLISYAVLSSTSAPSPLVVVKALDTAVLAPIDAGSAIAKMLSTAVVEPAGLAVAKSLGMAVLAPPDLAPAKLSKLVSYLVLDDESHTARIIGAGPPPRPQIQAFEVPTRPGRPQYEVTSLAGFRYTLNLYWDTPAGVWMLDIADRNGVPLLNGLPLVTGVDLLEQYAYLNIGGALVVQSDFDWRVTPTFDNLGVYGHLYFIPTVAAATPVLPVPSSPERRTRAGIGEGGGQWTLPQPPRPPIPSAITCSGIFRWKSTPAPAACGSHLGQVTSFNPADAGAGIVVSNSNFTAYLPAGAGAQRSVRSITHRRTGKWYAVLHVDVLSAANGSVFGISDHSQSLNLYPGMTVSVGYYSGNIYKNGLNLPVAAPTFGGPIYQVIAFDLDAGLFWGGTFDSSCNLVAWSGGTTNDGNPSTGFHGGDIASIITGEMYLIWGAIDAGGANQATLFTNTLLPHSTLNGFKRWDDTFIIPGIYTSANYNPLTPELDIYHNYLLGGTIFNPSGIPIVENFTGAVLADMIDAWFGSPIVSRVGGFWAGPVTWGPILQGQYILAGLWGGVDGSGGFQYWVAILQPSASGTPTLLGAVFYNTLTGNPSYGLTTFLTTNQQTADDPLMVVGSAYPGANGQYITATVVPSVNAIIAGIYKATGYPGLGGLSGPCRLPSVFYTALGTADLSNGLFAYNPRPNGNVKGIWTLPALDGGTNIYMYFSRGYIETNAPGGIPSCIEIHNVIGSAYPLGCVVRIKLGVMDYATLANFALANGTLGPTPGYTIDNAHWIDRLSVVQVPFTDEYTYVSTGLPGGQDTYQMQPAAVIQRSNGTWWVIMIMQGLNDSYANFPGPPAPAWAETWDTVRIFNYNPATEIFTQILRHSCRAYVVADIPVPAFSLRPDFYVTISLIGSELRLDGYIADGLAYSTTFGSLEGVT